MKWLRTRAQLLFGHRNQNAEQSLQDLSQQSSIPKSSVHRQCTAQDARIDQIGHDFFETEAGFKWFSLLIHAVILVFGIHGHVGSDIICRFFKELGIDRYIGSKPSTVRKMKAELREGLVAYNDEQWQKLLPIAPTIELSLGTDDMDINNKRCLTLMDLPSGVILTEVQTDNRRFKTWWSRTGKVIQAFKNVSFFISDGANVLKKLGAKIGTVCGMDLFHLQYDATKLFGAKIPNKIKWLTSKLKKHGQDSELTEEERANKTRLRRELSVLYKAKKAYKSALFTISTKCHPFDGLKVMTSSAVKKCLLEQHGILKGLTESCHIEDKYKLLNRIKGRIKSVSHLNDLWFGWVEKSLACQTTDSTIAHWAKHVLLPYYYWQQQAEKTRKPNLKRYYQSQVKLAKKQLDKDKLTDKQRSNKWNQWAKSLCTKFQRTTSAIEGRNARLAEHYFNNRGLTDHQLQALTVIHNFWIERDDGTTAIERLFNIKPPNALHWLTENVNYMPLPRERKKKKIAA